MLSSVQRLLFVRRVPIFQELRDDFLVRLASIMDELSFPANHTIFTQGEEGRSLYVVVSGRVRVHIENNELAQLSEGNCFGEMSLFDTEPRSATITTLESCECLVLTQQQLYEAIDETPGIAVNVIALLSRRIRALNDKLRAAEQAVVRSQAQSTAMPQFVEPQSPMMSSAYNSQYDYPYDYPRDSQSAY